MRAEISAFFFQLRMEESIWGREGEKKRGERRGEERRGGNLRGGEGAA